MMTPDSVLYSSHLANGDISQESMETDSETPLGSAQLVAETPVAPPTSTPTQSSRRSGKKKKKRGRKPKEKTQVDTTAAVGGVADSTPVAQQQQHVADQDSRIPAQGGGGVMGGVSDQLMVHSGDDVLRTSREQMEVDRRSTENALSAISSSMSAPSIPPAVLANSFGSNQAQPVSETGQTRLTGPRAPSATSSAVSTPPRESPVIGLPLGAGGVVRVKQEPITNHEDEMEINQVPPTAQHSRQPTTKVHVHVVISVV